MTDIKNILAKYGLTVAADKLTEFENCLCKQTEEVNKTENVFHITYNINIKISKISQKALDN